MSHIGFPESVSPADAAQATKERTNVQRLGQFRNRVENDTKKTQKVIEERREEWTKQLRNRTQKNVKEVIMPEVQRPHIVDPKTGRIDIIV